MAEDQSPALVPVDGEAFAFRITTSQALKKLTFSHLDQPLFVLEVLGDDLEIERQVEGIDIPPEGIEFWVEAEFSDSSDGNQRAAVGIELIPENLERTPKTVTLWGRQGESTVEDLAVFVWGASSD